MTRILIAAAALALLAGCAQIQTGYEVVAEKVCSAPLQQRFARKVVFDGFTKAVPPGDPVTGADCDGDGAADALGSWLPPK
jgi:hypothetical protein